MASKAPPRSRPPVAAAISAEVQSGGSSGMDAQGLGGFGDVVEGMDRRRRRSDPAHGPCPATTSTSPSRSMADGLADGLAAVADLAGAGRSRRSTAARMAAGSSRARIVVGDDGDVGQPAGDLAHQRALALVAVAAGAEHHDQPAAWRAGAGPSAPSPGRRACGRSRHRPRRRLRPGPTRCSRPGAPSRLLQRRQHLVERRRRPRCTGPRRPGRWRPGRRRPAAAARRSSRPSRVDRQALALGRRLARRPATGRGPRSPTLISVWPDMMRGGGEGVDRRRCRRSAPPSAPRGSRVSNSRSLAVAIGVHGRRDSRGGPGSGW